MSAVRKTRERQELAGSSHTEPLRESQLRDTLLTLVAQDSVRTIPTKGGPSVPDTSCPMRTVAGMESWWRKPIGTGGVLNRKCQRR